MTDDTVVDTTIREPSTTAGEVEMLLFALERGRATFAWKTGGLDAEALHRPHPPSAMTLGGLIKHIALVEDLRILEFLTGEMLGPWQRADFERDPDWEWHSAADDSPEELYALWQGAVQRSREVWKRLLAAGDLDQPSVYTTDTGEHPNLRRVLVDTIEEYSRHNGHADLMREAIDGLVGEDPPQA